VLRGLATPAGTRRYAAPHAAASRAHADEDGLFRPFADGLLATSLGIGTYLGECDDAEDARYVAAVRAAFARGINLVDTAINYRCQRSERAVGAALSGAIAEGVVRRNEVVLCTKGGYVPLEGTPPATRAEYREYLEREFYRPGIMTPDELVAGGHCLSPRFLAHQLARSRANLGVAAVDVYYLHNPEQQLDAVPRERVRALVRDAFALLEERVAAGEVGCYGCATWNAFRAAPGTRGHLELADLVGLAREVAGEAHHFRVIQLPLNLAMPEAVRTPTQTLPGGARVSVLQAAAELGITVVASAALMQGQLAHGLPDAVRDTFAGQTTDAGRAIAFVRSLPGVSTALVGMKSATHVEENVASAQSR
jgi:aryl-alcohol dehydrogenase-like predicted oxidoreductase